MSGFKPRFRRALFVGAVLPTMSLSADEKTISLLNAAGILSYDWRTNWRRTSLRDGLSRLSGLSKKRYGTTTDHPYSRRENSEAF